MNPDSSNTGMPVQGQLSLIRNLNNHSLRINEVHNHDTEMCRVRRGNLERSSKSSVNSKLQVQFWISNVSMNWAFSN